MTAKEKALSLCQKIGWTTVKTDFNDGMSLPLPIAKKIAIIMIDEFCNRMKVSSDEFDYWFKVKGEINLL